MRVGFDQLALPKATKLEKSQLIKSQNQSSNSNQGNLTPEKKGTNLNTKKEAVVEQSDGKPKNFSQLKMPGEVKSTEKRFQIDEFDDSPVDGLSESQRVRRQLELKPTAGPAEQPPKQPPKQPRVDEKAQPKPSLGNADKPEAGAKKEYQLAVIVPEGQPTTAAPAVQAITLEKLAVESKQEARNEEKERAVRVEIKPEVKKIAAGADKEPSNAPGRETEASSEQKGQKRDEKQQKEQAVQPSSQDAQAVSKEKLDALQPSRESSTHEIQSNSVKMGKDRDKELVKRNATLETIDKLKRAGQLFAEKLEDNGTGEAEHRQETRRVEENQKREKAKLVLGTVELNYDANSKQRDEQLQTLKDSNRQIQTDLDDKIAEIKRMKEDLAEKMGKIEEFKREILKLKQTELSIQKQKDEFEDEITQSKYLLDKTKIEFENSKKANQAISKENQEFKEKIQKLESDIVQIKKENVQIKENLTTRSTSAEEYEKMKQDYESLERQVQEKSEKIQQATDLHSQMLQNQRNSQAQIESLKQKIQDMERKELQEEESPRGHKEVDNLFFKGMRVKGRLVGKVCHLEASGEIFIGNPDGRGQLINKHYKLFATFKEGKRASEKVIIHVFDQDARVHGKVPLSSDDIKNDIKLMELKLPHYSIKCLVQTSTENFRFSGVGVLRLANGVTIQGMIKENRLADDDLTFEAVLNLPDQSALSIKHIAGDDIEDELGKKYKIDYEAGKLNQLF